MRRLALPGHYAQVVEIDLCADCDLVWFDLTETARLTGAALLDLIRHMADAHHLPHEVLRKDASCARCGGPLKVVHNRSRWGRSLQLQCFARHGAHQSFAQFLQEKGLLRPMSRIDRAQLIERSAGIACVNCGAAVGVSDEHCAYCRSVPSLFDVARLAHALDPEGVIAPQAVHGEHARQSAMQCCACGSALPPGQTLSCLQCGATLAVSRLADAVDRVNALGPALRAHALKPAPQVVKRRLDALSGDLPRRRAWAQEMQAEARQQLGTSEDDDDWSSQLDSRVTRWIALLLALAIWFVWRTWD